MSHQQKYDSLIERGKNRTLKGYSERHHIIPKCMGGSNKKENLVHLTALEHFEAHQLLIEIYPENEKLDTALFLMLGKRKKKSKKIDAKEYERLRKRHAKTMSKLFKDVPLAEEHKKNLRKPKGPMAEEHKEKLRGPQTEEQKINNAKAHWKPIFCTTNGIIYPSTKEAAEKLGLHASGIFAVLKGKYKHTGGYHFEYVNKEK